VVEAKLSRRHSQSKQQLCTIRVVDVWEHHGFGDTRRRDPARWFDDGIDVCASSYDLILSVFGACLLPLPGVASQVRVQGPLFWADGSVMDPDSRNA